MSSFRSLLLASVLIAAAAAPPALAQEAQDFVGRYAMEVTSKSGPGCGGDDSNLVFVVQRIAGPRLTFGFDDEEKEIADYDAASRTFRFEQAVAEGDREQSGVLTGKFIRQTDAVRLELKIESERCSGTLVGLRPAPALTAAPAAPAGPPTAASEDAAGPAAPAAAEAAAPAATTGMSTSQMALFGAGGLALLAAGVGIGWFLSRRKDPPPPKADEPGV